MHKRSISTYICGLIFFASMSTMHAMQEPTPYRWNIPWPKIISTPALIGFGFCLGSIFTYKAMKKYGYDIDKKKRDLDESIKIEEDLFHNIENTKQEMKQIYSDIINITTTYDTQAKNGETTPKNETCKTCTLFRDKILKGRLRAVTLIEDLGYEGIPNNTKQLDEL
ncbi:MAG TPA: hypothetical protein VGW78_04470 [Candidatus Babeliales bacterium]|nr:hypothetical protein [Candidatus Babeliales bacterium]